MDETTKTIASSALHRRTVVKGAAWSVPAITLLAATPAFAASNNKLSVTAITATRTANGSEDVNFVLSVSNTNTATPITISSISFPTNAGWTAYTNTVVGTYAAGSTGTISFTATEEDASSAFLTLAFTLVDSRGATYNVTVTINAGTATITTAPVTFSQV